MYIVCTWNKEILSKSACAIISLELSTFLNHLKRGQKRVVATFQTISLGLKKHFKLSSCGEERSGRLSFPVGWKSSEDKLVRSPHRKGSSRSHVGSHLAQLMEKLLV